MYRILIAEDKSLIRKGIISVIDWNGLNCTLCGETGNGQDAIQILKDQTPDILLTDIRMPRVDGLKLMDYVQENQLPTQVIVISGYDNFSYARHAINTHCVDYILKPINPDELNAAIRKAIERLSALAPQTPAAFSVSDALHPALTRASELTFSDLFPSPGAASYCMLLCWNRYHDYEALPALLSEFLPPSTPLLHTLTENTCVFAWAASACDPQTASRLGRALQNRTPADSYYAFAEAPGDDEPVSETFQFASDRLCAKIWKPKSHFVSCSPAAFSAEWKLPLNEAQLCDLLIAHNEKSALKKIQGIADAFTQTLPDSFALMKATLVCSYSALLRVFTNMTLEINEQVDRLANLDSLVEVENLQQLLLPLRELIIRGCRSGSEKGQGGDVIQDVLTYIENHYADDLSLTALSQTFHLTPSYLSSLFKQTEGVGINRYVSSLRLQHAALLLQSTDLPISVICEQVGFSNYMHFSKTFKAYYGMSPSDYKKAAN